MLQSGEQVGSYQVVRELGRGGMGVVSLARDTRLERLVAIKALPEHLASDKDRLARFEREAKIVASLNHPGIASVYALEDQGGRTLLVMEYVEGETLADRLRRGALPPHEALEVATRIAEAVDAAHEKGVIHRDLKPGNIMLTPDGGVKVLDFGLARSGEGGGSSTGFNPESPTLTTPAPVHSPTIPGAIMGTAGYMSPEQARGRPVDKRSDIFSFGCVLYEMLTGEGPFHGETVSDAIGAVLHKDVRLDALPAGTPDSVRRALRRCLERDRSKRYRDMGDVRLDLSEPSATGAGAASEIGRGGWLSRALVALVLGGALGAAGVWLALSARGGSGPVAAAPVRKFVIPINALEPRLNFSGPQISPDGRRLAYPADGQIVVRDLEQFEHTTVPGSEGAMGVFWSPDGRHIGFTRDRTIYRWPVSGGQPMPVCAVPSFDGSTLGGAWGRDGRVYFAVYRGGIYWVPASGGEPTLLIAPAASEVDFHAPVLLPGGKHLLAVAHRTEGDHPVIVISVADGSRRDLRAFDTLGSAAYCASSGHVLLNYYGGREKIVAVPFSLETLDFSGEPVLVAPGGELASVSDNGTLVYCMSVWQVQREFAWVNKDGRTESVFGLQRGLQAPAVSPDGKRAAVVAYEGDNADIWLYDLSRGTRTRFLASDQYEGSPAWVDNDTLVYTEVSSNWVSPRTKRVSVSSGKSVDIGPGWEGSPTPDGKTIVAQVEIERGKDTLWAYDTASPREPDASLRATMTHTEATPRVSPDGRWLAYASDETGRWEVFVRRMTDAGEKQQVSLDGGTWPAWSADGASVYYWKQNEFREAPVRGDDRLEIGAARVLFSATEIGLDGPPDLTEGSPIAVAPDGRFLVVRRSSQGLQNGILLVQNWASTLEEQRR